MSDPPPRNLDFLVEEQEAWEKLAEAYQGEGEGLPPLPPPPIISVVRPFKDYIKVHATEAIEQARESVSLLSPSEVSDLMHYEQSAAMDRVLEDYRAALPEVPEELLPMMIKCDTLHL
jgi:hypothetical protein